MRSTRFIVSVVVCLLLISSKTIFAQAALDCVTLVDQSLRDFGNSCRNLESGTLCYGHKSVTAQTNSSNSGSFQKSADQLPLNTIESLSTSAANLTNSDWGLALANMIPADSTTSVRLLLMGDAKLELAPTVPTGLQIGTGFGAEACSEAPSLAAIETTGDAPVALKINGIAAQATALVIFQQDSVNAIKAIVYSGTFAISGGATAQAGQTLAGVMDNKGTILFWSAPRPTNENETNAAAIVANAFTSLGILHPTPIPPTPTAIPIPPTQIPVANESCGEGVTHVVQPGENLFRIAMRYDTTIGAIQNANGITDMNQIIVGQTLVIPCGVDTGTSSVAPGSNDSGTQPTAAPSDAATPAPALPTTQTIDCSAFSGSLPPNMPPAFQQLFNQFCSNP